MVGYLILLFYFCFFSEGFGRGGSDGSYRYNLILFHEIRRFIKYEYILGPKALLINVFGNIAAFMPFGFLVPRISKHPAKGWMVTLMALELSLCIELLQLFFKLGSFDVDDLFLNTVGGLLGYLFYFCVFGRKENDH